MKLLLKAIMAIICIVALPAGTFAADNARNILDRAASNFRNAASLNAAYTVITQSGTINGEIKASGDKFRISSPQLSTWFDGKTQWTYSPDDNEVTVSEPTPEELTMTNPFEIINTLRDSFSASTVSAGKSRTTLRLIARDKTSEISEVTLTLDSSTLFPVRIGLTTRSGKITINLSGVKKGPVPGISEFRFNKALYPGAMVNDMR